MIVSHKFKCVFVAAPKAGSCAVETFFIKPWRRGPLDLVNLDVHPNKHLPYREILKLVPEAKDYFAFAFVRNPRAVVVSQYHMWRERLFPYCDKDFTFDDWVLNYDYLRVTKFAHIIKGVPNLYKYETQQDSWPEIFEAIGGDYTYEELPVVNTSATRRPASSYYGNPAVCKKVDTVYAEEWRLWRSL